MKYFILLVLVVLCFSGFASDKISKSDLRVSPKNVKKISEDISVFLMECIEVADRLNPSLANRLRELSLKNPAALSEELRSKGNRFVQLVRLKKKDIDLYNLKIQQLVYEQMIQNEAVDLRSKKERNLSVNSKPLWELVMAWEAQDIAINTHLRDTLRKRLAKLDNDIESKALNLEQRVEKITKELLRNDYPPIEVLRRFRMISVKPSKVK